MAPLSEAAPPVDSGLNGEGLLAAVGLHGFLAREHRRVSQADREKAARMPAAMAAQVRRFLAGETERPQRPGAFDVLKTIREVSQQVAPEDIEGMIGAHGSSGEALDMFVPLTRAVTFLAGAAPRRGKQSLFDAEQKMPSDIDVARFRRLYEVLDDPMVLMRHLLQRKLLDDEVQAVAMVYPALYAGLTADVARIYAELLARKPKHRPSYRDEAQLQTLLQSASVDPELVPDMQASFAGEQQDVAAQRKPARSSAMPAGKANSHATAGQATEGAAG